jgi:hypothetical protein
MSTDSPAPLFDPSTLTDSGLERHFGVPPPELFARFVRWVFDRAGQDREAASNLYLDLTGLYAGDEPMLYPMTPRELFSVGGTGGDGEHCGFVCYDIPVEGPDFPWMSFVPGDGQWTYLAPDTPTFLAQVLSLHLADQPPYRPQRDTAIECAKALGITVDADIVKHRSFLGALDWTELKVPRPTLELTLPSDWRAVAVKDDLPVVGRVEEFDDRDYSQRVRFNDFDQYITEAQAALDRRHYGTAAWILRRPPPFDWHTKQYENIKDAEADLAKQWPVCNAVLVDTYVRWNRPRIAERLRREPMW